MNIEKAYKQKEKEILKMIQDSDYPSGHPFLDYPSTPESMPLQMLIFVYLYTKNKEMIEEFVKKCNGKEGKVYSFKKYREGMSELVFLYYTIVGIMKSNETMLLNIYDENYKTIDNEYKFEYSFLLNNPDCVVSFEVKSLSCDPFDKESIPIQVKDGQRLIKPFFHL